MTDMYLKLGTQDLTGKIYGEIKTEGGFFDVKQDGATSLVTGARKGDPKGFSASFFVCFATEAEASAFLAYVAPYSPEDPDFDEEEGADIDLYLRTDDWKYRVWGVVVKPAALGKSPMDYLQYCYEVVCYCYSPYSEAATPQAYAPAMARICVTPGGYRFALDNSGALWWSIDGILPWTRPFHFGTQPIFTDLTADNSRVIAITSAGVAWEYPYATVTWAELYGGVADFADVSIASDGTVYVISISTGKLYRRDGASWVDLGGAPTVCAAKSATECWVADADGTWKNVSGTYTHMDSITAITQLAIASDGTLFGVRSDYAAMQWNGTSWDVIGAQVISVGARAGSEGHFIQGVTGIAYKRSGGLWTAECGSSYPDNTDGHIASAPDLEIACEYLSGRAENLTVAIADSETLVLATQANSTETWELIGNENKLLQTYEDAITAGTQWARDWVGDGTFDTDHIELDNGEAAYIRLSGPHPIRKPIKMTADLSLDSGGATGIAVVQISPDGVSWENVLYQDDFESGNAEYSLPGSKYMTDCYVCLWCASGTSGKRLNIGSIKFEVERWIEDGAVPVVAAGATKVLTVSATGGAIAVSGTFTPRRKFL